MSSEAPNIKVCPHCREEHDGLAQVRVLGHRFHERCWVPWLEGALKEAPCGTCGGLVYIEDSWCPDCAPEAEEARTDAITPAQAAKVLLDMMTERPQKIDPFDAIDPTIEALAHKHAGNRGDGVIQLEIAEEFMIAALRTIAQEDKQ